MPDSDPTPPPPRPGTQASQPSASNDVPELPYAEELQAMLEGRYIVESFLGQGGMGAVYRGLQMPLKRPVAIKILAKRGEGVEDDNISFEERFKREAYAMAALTHPHIVQVYDCGDAGDNWLFISMELVEGGDLSDAIKARSVTPEIAFRLIPQICDGLQAAHERGIVHRDIKPANIFLTADGRAKVADFGLAKKFDVKGTLVTKTGLGMGTPDYAAPEQYEGISDLDHRADIYALGVMMYQMITGKLPRGAFRPASQRAAVDPRIDTVLAKAMEQDRALRYQSVADIKNALKQITATPVAALQPVTHTIAVPVATRPTTADTQMSKPVTRQPGATSVVPAAARGPGQAKPVEPEKAGPNFILIGIVSALVIGVGAIFALKRPSETAPEPSVTTGTPSGSRTISPSDTTKSSVSVTRPPPVTAPLGKPGDLLTFGGHRYQLIAQRLPWGTANAKAEAMGGHLAVITSEAENEWMQTNVARAPGDSHVFLGATRSNATGAWTWVTGTPVDLSLWGGNGPDGSGGELTWLGKNWDDVGGNQSFMSLVEWDDDVKPAPPLTGPVNLLATADAKRDAVKGEWQKTSDGLVVTPPARGAQLLGFNYVPPVEYDFETEFSITGGEREVGQILPVPGGGIMWKMGMGAGDPSLFCFGPLLDRKDPRQDPARSEALIQRLRLIANRRYRSLVEVRKNSLRALIDGEEVLKWSGDLMRFSNEGLLTLPNPAHPGVSSFNTSVIFYKVEVRPALATPTVASNQTAAPTGAIPEASGPSPTAKFRPVDVVAQRMAAALAADPRLAQLDASFRSHLETDVGKPFQTGLATLNQSYTLNGIARARAAAQSRGNAAEVAALDAEKTAVEKGVGVPQEDAADTPTSIKTLRNTYRTALAKLTAEREAKAAPLYDVYMKALDAYVIELTKSDKIADAQRAKNLRNDIAQRKTGEPAPSAPLAGPPRIADSKAATELFNGRTLEGWKTVGAQESFAVDQGAIKTTAEKGSLIYVGAGSAPPAWTDFDLSFKVKTGDKANSGVWVHCPANPNYSANISLQIQIANENGDKQKTGSIWGLKPLDKILVHDGDWVDMRIVVRGKTITVFLNGAQVNEWTQPEDWKPSGGTAAARLASGTIGFESWAGAAWFKDIKVILP